MLSKAFLLFLVLSYISLSQAAVNYTFGEGNNHSWKGTLTDGANGALTITLVYKGNTSPPITASRASTLVCCNTAVSSTTSEATALKDKCWAIKMAWASGQTCNNAGKSRLLVITTNGSYSAPDKFVGIGEVTVVDTSSAVNIDDTAMTYVFTTTLTDTVRKDWGFPKTNAEFTSTLACYSEFNAASTVVITSTTAVALPTTYKETLTMGDDAVSNAIFFSLFTTFLSALTFF